MHDVLIQKILKLIEKTMAWKLR